MITGYAWQKGEGEWNGDSCFLQQGTWGKKSLAFGGVCTGVGAEATGVTASGYLAAQLAEWFLKKGTGLLRKAGEDSIRNMILAEMGRIYGDLYEFGRKKQVALEVSMTGILIAGSSFWIFHGGSGRAYLLNRRFGKSCIRLIMGREEGGELIGSGEQQMDSGKRMFSENRVMLGEDSGIECLYGRIQRRVGVLLGTEGFYAGLPPGILAQCLAVQEIESQLQVEKRLTELIREGRRRGGAGDGSAVYIQTD